MEPEIKKAPTITTETGTSKRLRLESGDEAAAAADGAAWGDDPIAPK
jgi:hypothetical protein